MSRQIRELLLVEDSEDDADLTLRAFRSTGSDCKIVLARNGAQALEVLLPDDRYRLTCGHRVVAVIVVPSRTTGAYLAIRRPRLAYRIRSRNRRSRASPRHVTPQRSVIHRRIEMAPNFPQLSQVMGVGLPQIGLDRHDPIMLPGRAGPRTADRSVGPVTPRRHLARPIPDILENWKILKNEEGTCRRPGCGR